MKTGMASVVSQRAGLTTMIVIALMRITHHRRLNMSLIMRKVAQLCLDCDVIFGNAFHELTKCPRCGSSAFTPISRYIKGHNDKESLSDCLNRIKELKDGMPGNAAYSGKRSS